MHRSTVPRRILLGFASIAVATTALVGAQTTYDGGADAIDVRLRTVPFYAVDRDGAPVFDLEGHEVELRIGDTAAPPDAFDHWVTTPGVAHDRPPTPRHVFLLFDQIFTSPAAIKRAQRLGRELIDQIPLSDRVHLLSYHGHGGFRYELGPIRPNDQGKRTLRAGIKALRPDVARVRSVSIGGALSGRDLGLAPVGPQQTYVYWAAATLHNSEYRDAALDLADAWSLLAVRLGQIQGPKLMMVFSGGIDNTFYLEGSRGLGLGSKRDQVHGRSVHFEAIRYRMEPALDAIASSGTIPIFVNIQGDEARGRSSLQHMSQHAGGLFLEQGSNAHVTERIAAATSAYYEAGLYSDETRQLDARAPVDVVIHRPGVRAVFPKRLKAPQRFASLTDAQRQLVVLDLVRTGEPSPALPALHALTGSISGDDTTRGTLHYRAPRPEATGDRALDLCDVAYRMAANDDVEPSITHYECRSLAGGANELSLETQAPPDGRSVWGIVAVDPANGDAYVQRLELTIENGTVRQQ